MYCLMSWGYLLGYMFSALFTQHKVAKWQIYMTALQKDKSNPGYSELSLEKNDHFVVNLSEPR